MQEILGNLNFLQWLINNGIGVAFAILLLVGIGRTVDNAVRYFTSRLDSMVQTQVAVADKISDHLDRLSEAAAANNESLRNIMIFVSQNMQQVVAHRQSIEGAESINKVPGPTIRMSEVSDTTDDTTPTQNRNTEDHTI